MKWIRHLLIALLVVFPVVLAVVHQVRFNAYPMYDEAEYMSLAMDHYRTFLDEGAMAGFRSMHGHRLWKPLFHPNLAVVPLFLSQGDVALAQKISSASLFALMMIFCFLTARLFLPVFPSLLVQWTIGFNWWIMGHGLIFGAQLSAMTFWMGTVYFGTRWYLSNGRPWALAAGITLGAAALCRPVEVGMISLMPTLCLLWRSCQQRRWVEFLIIPVTSLIVAGIWFCGFWKDLYMWTWTAAFSPDMKNYWHRPQGDFFKFLWSMTAQLFGISGLLFVGIALARFRRTTLGFFLGLVATCMVPLLVGAMSENGSYWFFLLSTLSGLLGLGILALLPGSGWVQAAIGLVVINCGTLVVAQFNAVRKVSFEPAVYHVGQNDNCNYLSDQVGRLIQPDGQPKKIGMYYYRGDLVNTYAFDRWCVGLVANERNWKFKLDAVFLDEGDEEKIEQAIGRAMATVDYLVIEPTELFEQSSPGFPQNRVVRGLGEACLASRKNKNPSLSWVGEFDVSTVGEPNRLAMVCKVN